MDAEDFEFEELRVAESVGFKTQLKSFVIKDFRISSNYCSGNSCCHVGNAPRVRRVVIYLSGGSKKEGRSRSKREKSAGQES